MNLATAFSTSAERSSKKTAIFWGEDEYSYEQLWTRSLAVAHELQNSLAVEPGDRVGLWLKNCPEFVPAVFGVFLAGGIVVPINNFLKPAEVSFMINDAGIDVLITDASMKEGAAALLAARPNLRLLRVEEFSDLKTPSSSFKLSERDESDLAVIIYTSGTTGRPKGAMLSHGNLLHNVDSCCQVLQAVGDDRFVVLLPMFHSFMLCVGVFLPLIAGGSMVLTKSLHPLKNVIQEIVHRKASILPAIPQFFRGLTSTPADVTLPLRLCVSGSAPLPAQVLKEFTERFSTPLLEGYGLSEASPVVSMNPLAGPWKAGSIGVPIPNVEVSVQNDVGEMLPVGKTGEICVRGGNVMQGYWNQPEETSKALRSGWLLTGDVGHRDAEGYFYITDRKKDMLLVNGINVYPREIEEVIYHFPGVKEAAVIGLPDPRRGEQPVAFVAANDGATIEEEALLKFVREKLADYKVPRRVVFLPALPRNATGKILKATLRQTAVSSISPPSKTC